MTSSISSIGDVRNKKVLEAWLQKLMQAVVEAAQQMNERWVIGVVQVFYGNVVQKASFKLTAVAIKPTFRKTTIGDCILSFLDVTNAMRVSPGGIDAQAHIEVDNGLLVDCPPLFEVRLQDSRLTGHQMDSSRVMLDLHERMSTWHQERNSLSGSESFYGVYGVVSALLQDGFVLPWPLQPCKGEQDTYSFELVQGHRLISFTIYMANTQVAKQRLERKFLDLEAGHATGPT